jgi:hypothetical protein
VNEHQLRQIIRAGQGGPLQAQAALRAVEAHLGDSGESQVHRGRMHRPYPGSLLELAESPSRLLVVPYPSVDPATTGPAVTVDFSGPGFGLVIGMRGDAYATDTGLNHPLQSLSLRFNINGDEEIVTDGQVQQFANFATLFLGNALYLPIRRRLTSTDRMNFFVQNHDVDTDVTPVLTLFFLGDKDRHMDDVRIDQAMNR